MGTSTDLRQMWSRLVGAVDCVRLPPLGRPVAAPRDTSSAYETLGYSEAGQLHFSLRFSLRQLHLQLQFVPVAAQRISTVYTKKSLEVE